MDPRPGGAWDYILHLWGANLACQAVFQVVEEPRRIVFAQDDFVASWDLAEADQDGTDLTVEIVFPSAARRDAVARDRRLTDAVVQSLQRLSEYLRRRDAMDPA